MTATAAPATPTPSTGQVGLKVPVEDLAVVNEYLAHRNIAHAAKRERKEFIQDHLRPAFDQLVKTARSWKAKQK